MSNVSEDASENDSADDEEAPGRLDLFSLSALIAGSEKGTLARTSGTSGIEMAGDSVAEEEINAIADM